MKVVEFSEEIGHHFKTINEGWIKEFFELEPIDQEILADPASHIISSGGAILFVESNGQILGTVALKKHTDQVVELTKMGVYPEARYKGLGKELINAAIDKAKQLGFEQIVLYTNRKLKPAIHLYQKMGFVELSCYDDLYERCDIKMEMNLPISS